MKDKPITLLLFFAAAIWAGRGLYPMLFASEEGISKPVLTWVTILIILMVLLGGAYKIELARKTKGKKESLIASLLVGVSLIAFGGYIFKRMVHYVSEGHFSAYAWIILVLMFSGSGIWWIVSSIRARISSRKSSRYGSLIKHT